MVDDEARRHWIAARFEPAEARAADHRPRGDRGVERDEEFRATPHRAEARVEPVARGRRSRQSRKLPRRDRRCEPPSRPVSPWIVAPVSGAVAAALVIGVGWMLGWPPIQPASAPPAPQLSAAIDGLTARVAGLEPKVGKPCPILRRPRAPRPLEKTVAALRAELAATRAQGEKLASAINDVKSAPRGDGAASPDLVRDR